MSQSKRSGILLLMSFSWINFVFSDPATADFPGGILYPRESETREVKLLDGIWNFRLSKPDTQIGFKEKWFSQELSRVSFEISFISSFFFLLQMLPVEN